MRPKIFPVILAGGQGKRLRPLTSPNRPKPFLKGPDTYSLFQDTLFRCNSYEEPVIVTHKDYLHFIKQDCDDVSRKPEIILTEPYHIGTACAITLAADYLRGCDGVMMVMPSDQVFFDQALLERVLDRAAINAINDRIVQIGAWPTRPETRYGYIMTAKDGKVSHFHEKPNKQQARALLKLGNAFWNTGIFLCRPDVFLQEIETFEPGLLAACRTQNFDRKEPISVDHAVMERSSKLWMQAYQGAWSDVGIRRDYIRYCALKRICSLTGGKNVDKL